MSQESKYYLISKGDLVGLEHAGSDVTGDSFATEESRVEFVKEICDKVRSCPYDPQEQDEKALVLCCALCPCQTPICEESCPHWEESSLDRLLTPALKAEREKIIKCLKSLRLFVEYNDDFFERDKYNKGDSKVLAYQAILDAIDRRIKCMELRQEGGVER